MRSRIILALAESGSVTRSARATSTTPATVRLWRDRFIAAGPVSLLRDAPGRGRRPALPKEARDQLRANDPLFSGLSVRDLAVVLGVSAATVSRWRRRT